MREFKIIKSTGAEFDLMRRDAFFHAPEGLGFEETTEAYRISDSYILADAFLSQKSPAGEMVFKGYPQYKEFVDFISDGDLTLAYKPLDTWYYLKCRVQSMDKTEIGAGNVLVCPIVFIGFGTWYEALTVISGVIGGGNSKRYPYPYGYKYGAGNVLVASINNGAITSPCRINIEGYVENPKWILYQGNTKICEGVVNVTVPSNQKLVIDSNPDSMEIAVYTMSNEFVSDAYQDSDFTTQRFIYLPAGECNISFVGIANANVEVKKLAYSV